MPLQEKIILNNLRKAHAIAHSIKVHAKKNSPDEKNFFRPSKSEFLGNIKMASAIQQVKIATDIAEYVVINDDTP